MLPNESIIIEGLWDSPKAFLASELVKTRSVLLITEGTSEDRFFDNLSYFAPKKAIEFPAWETLPGEEILPSPDIIGKRFEALYLLTKKKEPSIVLCPLASLLHKIAPPESLKSKLHIWKKGDEVSFNTIGEFLTSLGYRRSPVVSDKGEFAIRGGILDVFPISSSDPFRIEFFSDTIETIKTFDPVGQKTISKVDQIFLSPAVEDGSPTFCIADYLNDPIIFWDDLLAIENAYVKLLSMPASKSKDFFQLKELLNKWKKNQHIFSTNFTLKPTFEMFDHTFHAKPFKHEFFKIEHAFHPEESPDPHLELVFLNANDTEEIQIKEKLKNITLPKNTKWEKGYLTSGFCYKNKVLIPNIELTGASRIRRQKWRSTYHSPASEFHELTPGDTVVHFHSGIGKFLGLEKHTNHLGVETEFLSLAYADNSKLYVPLSQSHLVSRYIGAHETSPVLSQLGGKRWQQIKANAQAQIVGYANELLQLYAERAVQGGFRYATDSDLMKKFESDFPYLETEDQSLAIQALKEDMISNKPMDRLICGDVGYGKTEVAMRAAFKAVVDGQKQVAVLVPTTVLAVQHFESFCKRMGGFPVQIGLISRFNSPKQNKQTLEDLKVGKIDILIGTHRILSKDVHFKDLGLIIIDEEQRFGVKAKEHLKKFKKGADCLTLSATPIPRTLYMSLVHARDMSIISTPPQDRLPVKTIIAETDLEMIQNALLRELSRGGQAFFIHNRVETIHEKAEMVQKLLPNAKLGVVHGQMDPDDVDDIFHKFKRNEIDILFATTIVENGIDVANANTILIDQANTYGLADLYQLRGRVGRWNRAAYAYFLIPKHLSLPEPARKRLNALVEANGYGGGMKLAMRDLEIRGAGDILGVQQSGQVSAVGFHLYCKMLKRAIDALKKQVPITFNETKMEFQYDARLTESYINEVSLRMEIYYRLGEVISFKEVDELFSEMKDRFGKPPEQVIWLYHMTKIRVFGTNNHFTLLKFNNLSLLAEQQKGKETNQQTILLPKKVQNPMDLENYVIEQLEKYFVCRKKR